MRKFFNPLPPITPPPPVKKIMVPSLRPAGSHGEEETVFFSALPSPPLPSPFHSSRPNFLDELTQKRFPRRISDACI